MEENEKIYLSQKGYIQFYQLQSKELKRLAKSINEKRRRRIKILKRAIGIAIVASIITLLVFIYI